VDEIKKSLGEIPIVDSELRKAAGEEKEGESPGTPTTPTPSRTLVTDDGTYATQSAITAMASVKKVDEKYVCWLVAFGCLLLSYLMLFRPPLRGYLLDGDFFVGAALATTLTKLALRFISLVTEPQKQNVMIQGLLDFVCVCVCV
jgi:coatomer subunit beta